MEEAERRIQDLPIIVDALRIRRRRCSGCSRGGRRGGFLEIIKITLFSKLIQYFLSLLFITSLPKEIFLLVIGGRNRGGIIINYFGHASFLGVDILVGGIAVGC